VSPVMATKPPAGQNFGLNYEVLSAINYSLWHGPCSIEGRFILGGIKMKSKIIAVSIILMLTGLVAVFATGQREELERTYGPRGGRGGMMGMWGADQGEKITVSGPVYFKDKLHPEIKSGDKEYELLVPRFAFWNLDIEEGQSVSVEGYTVEGMYCDTADEDEVHLLVTKAKIGDKEYDLESDAQGAWGGPGRGGRGPGRRGNMMRGWNGSNTYGRGWRS